MDDKEDDDEDDEDGITDTLFGDSFEEFKVVFDSDDPSSSRTTGGDAIPMAQD